MRRLNNENQQTQHGSCWARPRQRSVCKLWPRIRGYAFNPGLSTKFNFGNLVHTRTQRPTTLHPFDPPCAQIKLLNRAGFHYLTRNGLPCPVTCNPRKRSLSLGTYGGKFCQNPRLLRVLRTTPNSVGWRSRLTACRYSFLRFVYCCKLRSKDWARERFFGPNLENMNGLRSWFWARSDSLAITYTSSFVVSVF